MSFKQEMTDYLLRRGYSKASLAEEKISFLESPQRIVWDCITPAGTLLGRMSRYQEGEDAGNYRWAQADNVEHLPQLYGAPSDHKILYETGELVLTEGNLDRAAVKNCFPARAVYARLSKGVGKALDRTVRRYAKRVWLAYDMDDKGQEAVTQTEAKLQGIEVVTLKYPFKDPSKLFEERGIGRMREIFATQFRHFGD